MRKFSELIIISVDEKRKAIKKLLLSMVTDNRGESLLVSQPDD